MIIIERFEGNKVIIEDDEKRLEVSKDKLPKNAREGDVLKKNGELYEIDTDKTEIRRKEMLKLQNSLWS